MKRILFLVVALIAFNRAQAQYALGVGEKQVNAGLGLSNYGVPIYVGMDFGVDTDISAGFEVSYRNYGYRYFGQRFHQSAFGFMGNANYHFNGITDIPTQYDVYAGLNLGFFVWSDIGDNRGGQSSGLGLAAQIGGRYYFNSTTAINIEFSGGTSFGTKVGISIKI